MKLTLSVISDFFWLGSVVGFASGLGKLYSKCMKHLEQLALLLPWEEHRPVIVFLDSNMTKLWLKVVSVQVVPSQAIHMETNISQNRRLIVWNMLVKSHGRLQCVVDFHEEVCASVAHQ